jgi:predicted AlkP superfamily pyrophosphatase or phosphodiesterase
MRAAFRVSAALALALLPVLDPVVPRGLEPMAKRVVLVSLDGAADWMIDRWLEQGKAPVFAALARDGASADAALSTLPTLTSVAHASIWTGAPPSVTGVAGNTVLLAPPGEYTITDTATGFDSTARHAEPIWETAGRSGRRALVLQATGAWPFPAPPVQGVRLFDIYGDRLAPAQLVTGSLVQGRYTLDTPAGPATLTAIEGGTLQVDIAGRTSTIAPGADRAWTPPIPARVREVDGSFSIGVLDYSAMTGAFMLVRGSVLRLASSDEPEVEAFRTKSGTLVDEGAFIGWYYRERLGPTLPSSGTGRAEDRLVALTMASQSYFDGTLEYAATQPWDLLVCYTPALDEVGHALAGLVDPDSSRSTAALAERAWPYLERAYAGTIERFLRTIRERFPDATVIVTSDHGMEGTGRVAYPNVILRQAGLLEVDTAGEIDVSRTRAAVLEQRGGLVTLNVSERRGGLVGPSERASIKRQVTSALLAARDPETGGPVIRGVLDADLDGRALGFTAEAGADLVLDPAPDYAISTDTSGTQVAGVSRFAMGEGKHGPLPSRRKLQGIFYAAGPGVAPGLRLPLVRVTDIAPTVARLLGIPPPAQSTGTPILLDPR